jgi:hypothetical protein
MKDSNFSPQRRKERKEKRFVCFYHDQDADFSNFFGFPLRSLRLCGENPNLLCASVSLWLKS